MDRMHARLSDKATVVYTFFAFKEGTELAKIREFYQKMDARKVPVYDAGNYDEVLASYVGGVAQCRLREPSLTFCFGS